MVRMRTISNQSRYSEREPRTDISQVECNCSGCGMLRAGVCINCAEKIAAVILESGSDELAVRAVLGRLPRGGRAVLLQPTRALAFAALGLLRYGFAIASPRNDAIPNDSRDGSTFCPS